MKFSLFNKLKTQEAVNLFNAVFSASEGVYKGQVIADFVANLISTTKADDLFGCVAEDNNNNIIACIFFSRFTVPSGKVAFILSPVAVSTSVQSKGIGQSLIRYGLDQLRALNVDLAFTYGDPAYYSKTGFQQISENVVKAPQPLSQPLGWLAQSLEGKEICAMTGPTQCVEALNDPSLW